jgi:hypothetical protein
MNLINVSFPKVIPLDQRIDHLVSIPISRFEQAIVELNTLYILPL